MIPVLEAVPNFSEGRDLGLVREIVARISGEGADVLDWSADPDHNRSVVTFVGDPATVERSALAAARFAIDRIDLRRHRGVHPRVGALDVLPFVPLHGLTMDDAVASARRAGDALADLGVPVFWYGAAGPARRSLADVRRGGFEGLVSGDSDLRPDLDGGRGGGPHPSAGATCVGARRLLLAWNVFVEGVDVRELRQLAAALRERPPRREGAGGTEETAAAAPARRFAGLRVLVFELEVARRTQISMNLEDLDTTSPFDVFVAIERHVEALGGTITGTEVIGMIPDALVLPAATGRLRLLDTHPSRLLGARLTDHVSLRAARAFQAVRAAVDDAGPACPSSVRDAVVRFHEATRITPTAGDDA